jgi:hypothetical protein
MALTKFCVGVVSSEWIVWTTADPDKLLVGESTAKAPSGSFSVTGTPVSFIEAVEATLWTEEGGERF